MRAPVDKAAMVGRAFRLWGFSVSHSRMLVRSKPSETHHRNLDIVFYGVWYVDLPAIMPSLAFVEPTAAEVLRACTKAGVELDPGLVTVFESQGQRYAVVAEAVELSETDLEFHQTGLGMFDS